MRPAVSVVWMAAGKEPSARPDSDVDTDRVINADEAGLGHGLDQAEEAQRGIRDEDLEGDQAA
jgi:hypothetical protein